MCIDQMAFSFRGGQDVEDQVTVCLFSLLITFGRMLISGRSLVYDYCFTTLSEKILWYGKEDTCLLYTSRCV